MAKAINKLTARQVATLATPGRHSDGGGLYLAVSGEGRRRWVFLFTWAGRKVEMGLGSAGPAGVPLAKAREMAAEARAKLHEGINPLEARREAEAANRRVPTFGEVADEVAAALRPQWRSEKHAAQWEQSLRDHAKALRPLPVNEVDTEAVLGVLKPLWAKHPETASRLRGRIEKVLDAARVQGFRTGENPALWRGHLAHLLPARQRLDGRHFAAKPYTELPALITRLRARQSTGARALEFLILTAARTSEVTGATWGEIDLKAKVWTVPGRRMKNGREHRVPLAPRAVAILEEFVRLRPAEGGDGLPVFPGRQPGTEISNRTMANVLLRLEGDAATVHGFRSSFRDWAGETTAFPREVAEAALAHTVGDATERAYRRGDALLKRRKLMEAWAAFLEPRRAQGATVTPLRPTG